MIDDDAEIVARSKVAESQEAEPRTIKTGR